MSSISIPAGLYYSSSFLYFSIIPKHVITGISKIRNAVSTIPSNDQSSILAKGIIPRTWDYVVCPLMAFGILNYQWAQTGGPVTTAESLIMFVNAAFSLWAGMGYYKARLYVPLGVLWGAPALNLAALLLQ